MVKRLLSLGAAMVALLVVASPVAAAENGYVVVRPGNMHGWAFVNEGSGGGGGGQMVYGPAGQPLGKGSAELAPEVPADGWALGTGNHEGTKIASITSLDYWTYTRNSYAITVQLAVRNADDSPTLPGYHRLVFEPGVTPGNVQPNTWQRWSPTGSLAKWWFTNNRTALCTQAAPCTWTAIRTLFLTSEIKFGVWLKEGSGWPANQYNVDAFHFFAGTPSTGVIYDFEPERNGDSD